MTWPTRRLVGVAVARLVRHVLEVDRVTIDKNLTELIVFIKFETNIRPVASNRKGASFIDLEINIARRSKIPSDGPKVLVYVSHDFFSGRPQWALLQNGRPNVVLGICWPGLTKLFYPFDWRERFDLGIRP